MGFSGVIVGLSWGYLWVIYGLSMVSLFFCVEKKIVLFYLLYFLKKPRLQIQKPTLRIRLYFALAFFGRVPLQEVSFFNPLALGTLLKKGA